MATAVTAYEAVNLIGDDAPRVFNSPRDRYRDGQDNAIKYGIKLSARNTSGSCDVSTKASDMFRPWFLKKKSRYHQLVTRSYQEILGRGPTEQESACELARADQTDKWGLLMVADLNAQSEFLSASELERREAELLAQAEAEALTAAATAQAEAEALAIFEREIELGSLASLISYVY